ncbi:hypothetical protein [Acinetobacter nosocomialis]|uniref:hypothetical protein n=1 Tax=Acinetobacter nosocomialis TaxID=106654 RepID=UPI001B82CDEF|nr:hypothetical protein [Acinetobacter nosocomialis]MBR7715578.1 hypothetical protein [Acinetobacter nosocomialis]
MKPEQFIREFGVEKAKKVVESHSKAYMPELFKYWSEELQDYVLAPNYASFLVEDLKRLVESVDQVDAFDYGLAEAKDLLSNMKRSKEKYTIDFEVPAFEQVIRDYESIYGTESQP